MILWDIETGERLKTFDGHDRGLACIEFKVRAFIQVHTRIQVNVILFYRMASSCPDQMTVK